MRDEIDARMQALLDSSPLPDDAEERLDALIALLPPEERAAVAAHMHEALFAARAAEAFTGTVGAGVLDP